MIRVAAIADLHCVESTCGRLAPTWEELNEKADIFLIGGDLTTTGTSAEAAVLANELSVLKIPVVAVLGNHDYHANNEHEVRRILEDTGIHMLEGETFTLMVGHESVGVAGLKGFGGGFAGACGTEFGEPEMKAYIGHTAKQAAKLRTALHPLTTDFRIVLMHYAPIDSTLRGEPLPIYPFLGSYQFAEVVDEIGAELVVHGHAHHGTEKGVTPGGVPVRNVAMPLVRHSYQLFHLQHTVGILPFPEHTDEAR